MQEKYYMRLDTIENNEKILKIRKSMDRICEDIIIEKNKLIDDYIYKNLDTHILKAIKLKIENELLDRQLKEV